MYKDATICFLMRAHVKTLQISFMSAESSRPLGNNDNVFCRHLGNSSCQELEQLSLVVFVSEEVTPVGWNSILVCHLAPASLARFALVSALRLDLLYTSNTRCVVSLGGNPGVHSPQKSFLSLVARHLPKQTHPLSAHLSLVHFLLLQYDSLGWRPAETSDMHTAFHHHSVLLGISDSAGRIPVGHIHGSDMK